MINQNQLVFLAAWLTNHPILNSLQSIPASFSSVVALHDHCYQMLQRECCEWVHLRRGGYVQLMNTWMQVEGKDWAGWFKDREPVLEILEFLTLCKQPQLTRIFVSQGNLSDPDFARLPPSLDSSKVLQKYFTLCPARLRKRWLPLALLVFFCPFSPVTSNQDVTVLKSGVKLLQGPWYWLSRSRDCIMCTLPVRCYCHTWAELKSFSRPFATCERYFNDLGAET